MKNTGMVFGPETGASNGGRTPQGGAGDDLGGTTGGTTGDQQGTGAPTFETWYAGLEATHKALFDSHVQGLKMALSSERTQRADLARQVKDLATKAEKGSDLEKQLNGVQASLQAAERRATFAEDALRPEVGCVNAKAAYALAIAEDLFDRQGRPDWAALKQTAPELFRRTGAGSAGSVDGGAGNAGGQPRVTMNEIIRRAAGRG